MAPDYRKRPKQSRSRALVDAILEGARLNLERVGELGELTTKRIAKRAGVSIGSLYQYFPNKDAVFAALISRELSVQEARFVALVRDAPDMDGAVAAIVAEAERLFTRSPALTRLFLHAVRLGATEEVAATRRRVAVAFAERLREWGTFEEPLEAEVELLVHAIMGAFEAEALSPGALRVPNRRASVARVVRSTIEALRAKEAE